MKTQTQNNHFLYNKTNANRLNLLGIDERYNIHHDVIEKKRSTQDFYDENNEANLLEKEMIESYDSSIKDFLIVVAGIVAVYVFSNVLNTLINLF